MINILHIISDTNIGGAGMHLVTLTKFLDKSKFNVFIACPNGAKIIDMIDNEVTIIKVPSMKGDVSFDKGSIIELVKIIKKNSINIVHTHGSFSGRIAAKISGVKIVYTRHTPGEIEKKGNLKWLINKYLNLFLSDKVISVSNYISAQLKDMGITNKRIVTIYNGIDISEFQKSVDVEKVKQKYNLSDEFLLLEVARIEEGKGHKYLLEALVNLRKDNYNIKLIIAGDGSKRSELEELAKNLEIEDRVIFTGALRSTQELVEVYTACDVVMLPSLKEALGLVLIEGMILGKPCIASDVDGIPEVVSNNESGILVKVKDIDEIKNAIIRLYNDKELREKMGQEGKRIAQEKFNSVVMAKKTEELYLQLFS